MANYVYIHIPFCNSICSYCDFCKVLYNEKLTDRYLEALEDEIKARYNNEAIKSIYIGGGTPSSLNLRQLEKLFKIIKLFKTTSDLTITIEGNIESTTKEKLALYKKEGVTRLSFGIESIDKKNLSFLERISDLTRIKEVIQEAKDFSFDINVDLMYALPTENMAILNKDLDFFFSLDVNHISTYSLIIEDNTKLKIRNVKNISEDIDFLMYQNICKRMKDNNYLHYEISNFCKKGFESIHNLCYWKNEEYYGFGLGASSYIGNKRFTNTRSYTKYFKKDYLSYEELLTINDKIEYEIILNLRLKRGISLKEFYDKYKIELSNLYNYEPLITDKVLLLEKDNLFISEEKWYISNEIIRRFLEGRRE